eukprot:m.489391 g.489391  ORF g.489391 m.489391 type:complete len:76 (-) comp26699_c0_seq1:240-467(-)
MMIKSESVLFDTNQAVTWLLLSFGPLDTCVQRCPPWVLGATVSPTVAHQQASNLALLTTSLWGFLATNSCACVVC